MTRRLSQLLFRIAVPLMVLLTSLSAVGSILRLDAWRPGMLLTYPPRIFLVISTVVLTFVLVRQKSWVATLLTLVCLGVFVAELCGYSSRLNHNTVVSVSDCHTLNVMSMNVHEATDHVADLRAICTRYGIDVLLLQEVKPSNHDAFIAGLPEFQFFRADQSLEFEYSWMDAFSLLTAVRRDRLAKPGALAVETGLTGYRTFATLVELSHTSEGADLTTVPLWLVNVHSTKPFLSSEGITGAVAKAGWKAARHMTEFEVLNQWTQRQRQPLIAAGDFNAPLNVRNLQFSHLVNAQSAAGTRAHLTFPAAFPVWGIDHTLVSSDFSVHHYHTFDAGFSDHHAQIARLSLHVDLQPPSGSVDGGQSGIRMTAGVRGDEYGRKR